MFKTAKLIRSSNMHTIVIKRSGNSEFFLFILKLTLTLKNIFEEAGQSIVKTFQPNDNLASLIRLRALLIARLPMSKEHTDSTLNENMPENSTGNIYELK